MELACVAVIVVGCLWAAARMFGGPRDRPPSALHDPAGYREYRLAETGYRAAGCFYLYFGLAFLGILAYASLRGR